MSLVQLETVKSIVRLKNPKEKEDIVFEVNFKEYEDKANYNALIQGPINITGTKLTKIYNRPVNEIVEGKYISVVCWEVQEEISDSDIEKCLAKYGKMKGHLVRHLHKGFKVENGNRSILFEEIEKDIPTIIWVQGNKVKVSHEGQDRSPICSYCHTKGHYRAICKKEIEDTEFYERMQEEQRKEDEEKE